MSKAWRGLALIGALLLGSCATQAPSQPGVLHPEIWPRSESPIARDPAIEARVALLLEQMSVEQKVGQIIQADMASVTPEDVRRYHLGSVLNGGNSGPNGDDRALAPAWLAMADAYYDASMDVAPGRPAIPIMWGSDAVHGNSNIIGATIFPHNIGLGATRNRALLQRIGEITAKELRVVGGDWTFAPTIAVVRDDRWGRIYEGYSEEPEIVRSFAGAIIEGIQGRPGDADFLRGPHVLATAKHFLGDGGTDGGRDQGDNLYPETEFRDLFGSAYPPAIEAGVQTVMTSYNSWFGVKSTGNRVLLNDVLIDRFGFDGFVIDDWNAHGQVPGCTATSCAAAINAGVDMLMAPESWRGLYANTLAQVRAGDISMARLDEAVGRILRVKLRAGLFEAGRPSSRAYAGQWAMLGAAEHRAVARQAVRESLVLLKNDGGVLPLAPNLRVLVAGEGADDLGMQTGGWTISWQGDGNSRADFPNGETIFEAIRARVSAGGGSAVLSVDGSFEQTPDVAIVVFGERPYAEFRGDVATLDYQPDDARDLRLLQSLQARGVPVVSIFLSGRPMYVTPELNASNAFIAAWLPGSEAGGVADLLFSDGSFDFTGKLSFSWPRAPDQTPLNVGDRNYDPLFPFGYGLTYRDRRELGRLSEVSASAGASPLDVYFAEGRAQQGLKLSLASAEGTPIDIGAAAISTPGLAFSRIDRARQEDALLLRWSGAAAARLSLNGRQLDLTRQAGAGMSLVLQVRVDQAPAAPVLLGVGCGEACRGVVDVSATLARAEGRGWMGLALPLTCLGARGAQLDSVLEQLVLESGGALSLAVSDVRITRTEAEQECAGALTP
ncbi:MAG: exo 1,3/1,4-beta-D-glucan glucohydrolase [Hyphomonadaceae bacterium]|nr:exo 1,3/1,4-beta-D-glucan glucohydrolase [Hyphomonadaceae bacterium]